MATTAEQIRGYRGPAILSFGFRPRSFWAIFATADTRWAICSRVKPSGKTIRNGFGAATGTVGCVFVSLPPLTLATMNQTAAITAANTASAARRRR